MRKPCGFFLACVACPPQRYTVAIHSNPPHAGIQASGPAPLQHVRNRCLHRLPFVSNGLHPWLTRQLLPIRCTAPACMPAVTCWTTRRYKSGNRLISANGAGHDHRLPTHTAALPRKTIKSFIFNNLQYPPMHATGRHSVDFAKLHKERIRWIDVFL